MARGLFMLVCLLLALVVQHAVQTASATGAEETDPARSARGYWKKAIVDQLIEIKDALDGIKNSSYGASLGADVAQLIQEQKTMQSTIDASSSSIQKIKRKLKKTKEELREFRDLWLMNKGSTFVRWGRTTCPENTTLVYSGVAAGRSYDRKGSGTNTLCLTSSPQFDNTTVPTAYGYLYGGEYEQLNADRHEQDVPCSVCRANQSTTIMMAATLTCPQGWTAQYTGHLTSQYFDYYATEYVCLDGSPEDLPDGTADDDGRLFYYVLMQCGNLPCPPYADDKVVTCVVCSK